MDQQAVADPKRQALFVGVTDDIDHHPVLAFSQALRNELFEGLGDAWSLPMSSAGSLSHTSWRPERRVCVYGQTTNAAGGKQTTFKPLHRRCQHVQHAYKRQPLAGRTTPVLCP
ncbi:hypothetical protein ACOMHN_023403 [Nucella lapillus]